MEDSKPVEPEKVPIPKNHLIWVDPDDFDELLAAAKAAFLVLNDPVEDRLFDAIKTFDPDFVVTCVPVNPVI